MPGHRLFLVRHGETEWSRSGQHTGRTDIPLTEEGVQQGRLLFERLHTVLFALVLTSPMARAQETCRLAGLLDRAEVLPDLQEWDYGEYEGITTSTIRETRPDWTIWTDGAPGGEQAEQVGARADRVIARARQAEGDVALFSHGHMLRVLGARWVGLPAADGRLFMLSTASVSVLSYEREAATFQLWNGRAHLSHLD
ncbi:MAG: histidine phosphatase family protein [Candidatus Dormibacteraeota bacterium]|nr:histidine phosphatase family protein [Candidatus Dormibacteraeota bacterium]